MKALIFGYGYLGQAFAHRLKPGGWSIAASAREASKREGLVAAGVAAAAPESLAEAAAGADAVLVTAPPQTSACPGLKALRPLLEARTLKPAWLGFVATTGVDGAGGGGWVDETSAQNAPTMAGARRAVAERDWLKLGEDLGLTVMVLRLPAIYGPGRAPFEKLRDGTARIVRKPGQVFNRIHRDDAVSALMASMARPRAGGIYNICDDEPAGADAYVEEAARLLGLPSPPEVDWSEPEVSEQMRRFYLDNKRVSNARAKAELGWRPQYASWRDGLRAILAGE